MLLRSPRSDVSVLVTTFLLTIVFDLTLAIEIGIVMSAILLIRRLSLTQNIENITREISRDDDHVDKLEFAQKDIPKGVEIFEIYGPFFFAITATFTQIMNNLGKNSKVRILRMRNVSSIDATAINAFKQVLNNSHRSNMTILVSGIQDQPLAALKKSGLLDQIGEKNIFPTIGKALKRASEILDNMENEGLSD